MFKAHHFFIASLVMALSAGAFAGQSAGSGTAVSWDEFVGRCANPDNYQNQREPRQIKIQCTNIEREFVPDAPGIIDLAATRRVITAVFSDKFNVNAQDRLYAQSVKPGQCMRYKQVEKTFTIEKSLDCQQVLAIANNMKGKAGDISDYCAAGLDVAKGTMPKLVDIREAGEPIDTCGALAAAGKDGKGSK